MHEISKDFYALKLADFKQVITGKFILNGAVCEIENDGSGTGTGGSSGTGTLNSGGFAYTGASGIASYVPAGTTVATDLKVVFTLLKEHHPTLAEDVHGEVFRKEGKFFLHIKNLVRMLDFIGHDDFIIRLTQTGELTINGLREIIKTVRVMYNLPELEKIHDSFPSEFDKDELDALLAEIKKYLEFATAGEYQIDLQVDSTIGNKDTTVLNIEIEKTDGSKHRKPLLSINSITRKFTPSIILTTKFENDNDIMVGQFKFIPDGTGPLLKQISLSKEEANYLIREIQGIIASLGSYKYIK